MSLAHFLFPAPSDNSLDPGTFFKSFLKNVPVDIAGNFYPLFGRVTSIHRMCSFDEWSLSKIFENFKETYER